MVAVSARHFFCLCADASIEPERKMRHTHTVILHLSSVDQSTSGGLYSGGGVSEIVRGSTGLGSIIGWTTLEEVVWYDPSLAQSRSSKPAARQTSLGEVSSTLKRASAMRSRRLFCATQSMAARRGGGAPLSMSCSTEHIHCQYGSLGFVALTMEEMTLSGCLTWCKIIQKR